MSVRTETFGHEAPRIPLVSILAAILAFAIGIALGATVLDRDGDARVSAPGAAVEAPRGWDPGMLEAARQRTLGSTPFVYQPRDYLQTAEQTAGVTEPVLRGPDAGLPKRAHGAPEDGSLTAAEARFLRNQYHAA